MSVTLEEDATPLALTFLLNLSGGRETVRPGGGGLRDYAGLRIELNL